jgi:hypothetical protein
MAVFWVVAPCRLVQVYGRFGGAMIAPMMEAESTSGTSGKFYQTTRRNNPEDSHLRTHCSENLTRHQVERIGVKLASPNVLEIFETIL